MTKAAGRAPFVPHKGQVQLSLHIVPNARRETVRGLIEDAAGDTAVKLTVSAPPEDGRANLAVIKLLARTLGLPKKAFTIQTGLTARRKRVLIAGDPSDTLGRLQRWIDNIREEKTDDRG